jgi:hypothetical protein
VVAACDDATSLDDRRRQASLSFHVSSAASASLVTPGILELVVNGNNGRVVDVQSVDIVFSEITFEGRDVDVNDDDDSDSDSDSEHEGNERFRAGAATVALPLEGGVITPFTGTLPVGTFSRLEMDAEFARIRGTVDGQPFDVTVAIDKELEIAFSPPLVIDDAPDPVNVSVDIDVASWFVDASGAAIDPRQLSTNADLREAFVQRVKTSFKAFEDEDRDADEDDSDSDSDSENDNGGPGN